MDNDTHEDPELNVLFEAGRAQAPAPSDAFMARLTAEAMASVPEQEIPPQVAAQQVGLFERFKGLFAVSGLSGVAAVGLWIGFIMPDVVTTISPLTEDVTSLSAFLPGSDLSVLSE